MLYHILKPFIKISIRVYFKRIKIEGLENIPKDQPVVFAPNHPGAFLDPILLGTEIPEAFHVLARGESFQSKFKTLLFKSMKMIPIYRPDKSPEKMISNKSIFQKCYELLGEGKSIMIFPEGVSKTEYRLRKIKTGVARIIIGYNQSKHRNKNVLLIPVAINYDNPHLFRSKVYIKICNPINTSKYEALSDNNRVKIITEKLEESLLNNLKLIEDESQDKLIENLERYYLNEFSYYRNASTNRQKVQIFNRTVKRVNEMKRKFPDFYNNINCQLSDYSEFLKKCKINHKQLKSLSKVNGAFLFKLILIIPLSVIGLITHLIPFKLVHLISENCSENNSFRGALKVSFGLLVFLLNNLIWTFLSYQLFNSLTLLITIFCVFPMVGLLTFYWSRNLALLMKWISINYNKKDEYLELQKRRKQLMYSFDDYFGS